MCYIWSGPFLFNNSSATNNIIGAKDHASVQLNFGLLDAEGRFSGESKTVALCGYVRGMGEADDSLNRLCQEAGMLNKYASLFFESVNVADNRLFWL